MDEGEGRGGERKGGQMADLLPRPLGTRVHARESSRQQTHLHLYLLNVFDRARASFPLCNWSLSIAVSRQQQLRSEDIVLQYPLPPIEELPSYSYSWRGKSIALVVASGSCQQL